MKKIVGINTTSNKMRLAPMQEKCYTITATGKPKVHSVTKYAMVIQYEEEGTDNQGV